MTTKIIKLDTQGYRKFAITTSVILAILFGLLVPWVFNLNLPKWPWIVAGVLGLWGLVAPNTLELVYLGWMRFGNIMNWLNTRIIMGVMFYGLFLPLGILFKILGKDPMRRKLDKTASSYRIKSGNDPKNNVENPY